MSAIFISHCSRDDAAAMELRRRLSERGYTSVFLDFDPEDGIPAGRSWESELYHHLKVCRALIALCSVHSTASRWCFAEVTQARALGKPIFPIKIDACTVDSVLTDRQVVDLTAQPESGYERLWQGLERSGLDPGFDPDPSRPPYPGLNAFDGADMAYFFGREDEIGQAMERLARMRRHGEPRLALVLGASGCGKSSLVRAGVLPRLKRDSERWIVVPPFRPGDRPLEMLARALAEAFASLEHREGWRQLRDRLACGVEEWHAVAADLATTAGQREASVLLVIDQLEEVLDVRDAEVPAAFLHALQGALCGRGPALIVLATLRSDFFSAFQGHPELGAVAFETLPLGPMPVKNLPRVIEGPAELHGLDFEPGLVQRMVADTATHDALPLLAFTLRELYELCKDNAKMTLGVYEQELGGIQGALARVADDIAAPGRMAAESEAPLRSAFLKMVRVNEEGHYARRPARWRDLPEGARPVLEKLVAGRLLVASGDGEEREVEVAHEALFRAWRTLAHWLDEERSFLLWRRRLRADREDWALHDHDAGSLLQGAALDEARRWLAGYGAELEEAERAFIAKSLETESARRRRQRLARAGVLAGIVIAAALAALTLFLRRQSAETREIASARNLAIKAELIRDREAELLQLRALLATEAVKRLDGLGVRSVDADLALRRALALLPSRLVESTRERAVDAVAFSPDGRRLTVVSDRPRVVEILDSGTLADVVSHPLPGDAARANAVSLSLDGRYVASAVDGTNVDPTGAVEVREAESGRRVDRFSYEGRIWTLSLSAGGEYLALKGFSDDALSVWHVARHRELGRIPLTGKVAFSRGGHLAVSGTGGGVFRIVDVSDGARLERLDGFDLDGYRRIAFSFDGRYMASVTRRSRVGFRTRSLEIWSLEDEKLVESLPLVDRNAGIDPLALSHDRRFAAFILTVQSGTENSVIVQKLATGELARLEVSGTPRALGFSPDGSVLAVAGATAPELQLWTLTTETRMAEFRTGQQVETLRFGTDARGTYLAAVGRKGLDRDLRVFDVTAGRELTDLRRSHRAYASALSADARFLAVVTADGEAQIWGVRSGEKIAGFPYEGPAERVALSHDRRFLAAARTGEARIWTLPEGAQRTFETTGRVVDLQLGPAGRYLVTQETQVIRPGTRGERHQILEHVYNLDSGDTEEDSKIRRDLNARAVESVGSGGNFHAGVTSADTAVVWSSTGEEIARIEDVESIELAAVDPRGRYLATATATGLVRVWSLSQAELINMACRRLTRDLTRSEWSDFMGDDPFHRVCPSPRTPPAP